MWGWSPGGSEGEVSKRGKRKDRKSRAAQTAKDKKEIDQQGKRGGLGRQRKEGGIRKRKRRCWEWLGEGKETDGYSEEKDEGYMLKLHLKSRTKLSFVFQHNVTPLPKASVF